MSKPPHSSAQLKLAGTYRKDRHGARIENLWPKGQPEKPAGLPDEAARVWDLVIGQLPPGTAAKVDAAKLEGLCRWFAHWKRFDAQMDGSGDLDPYNATILAATAWKQFEKAAADFGMSPASRSRMKLSEAKPVKEAASDGYRVNLDAV